MIKKKIAILCYDYPIEVSSILKNIFSFLHNYGFQQVDVYVAELPIDKSIHIEGINIFNLSDSILKSLILRAEKFSKSLIFSFCTKILRLINFLTGNKYMKLNLFEIIYTKINIKKILIQSYVKKKKIYNYDLFISADYPSIDLLSNTDFDFSKVIFLSLEGTDCFKFIDKIEVLKNLNNCKIRIISKKERALEINNYLNSNLDFEYIPVALRPQKRLLKPDNSEVKLIYSGYLAEWSCLSEFIDLFLLSDENIELFIQGHSIGTHKYVKKIIDKIKNTSIRLDTEYYDDSKHRLLLNQYDIGLAFYKNYTNSDNFENLIFSSNKIATYLWSGLAIITNIEDSITKKPPFIFMNEFSNKNFYKSLEYFTENKKYFIESAYKLAEENYNLDKYMLNLLSQIGM